MSQVRQAREVEKKENFYFVLVILLLICLLGLSAFLSFNETPLARDVVLAGEMLEVATKPVMAHPGNFFVWEVGTTGKRFLRGILVLEKGKKERFVPSPVRFATGFDRVRAVSGLPSGYWQVTLMEGKSFLFDPKTDQFFFEE